MSTEKVPGGVVIRATQPHRCREPDAQHYNPGDVFVCDCGQRHVLRDAQSYQGGRYWTTTTQNGDGGR